jgi:hypothetical protein
MTHFFTSFKKYVKKNTGFISRLLGWNAKNDESRVFWGADIRDMKFQKLIKTN